MITEQGFEDGGPAFPQKDIEGMSLRDYFAGQYLSGRSVDTIHDYAAVARDAYALADSMLKARKTPNG